jgi:hypothetical protein
MTVRVWRTTAESSTTRTFSVLGEVAVGTS